MICNNTQSAFFLDEPENVRRGRSAIIWSFIFLVFTIIAWVSIEVLIQLLKNYTKGSFTTIESFAFCFSSLAIAFFLIVFLLYAYKFSIWIYYAVKEQNQYTTTEHTPLKAVLLGIVLGPFIDAYIFKDLFHKQNATLEKYGIKPAVLPEWIFAFIIVTTFLSIPACLSSLFFPGRLALVVLTTVIFASYIKVMQVIIANGRSLQQKRFDDLLDRKVEEILKQRENS